MKTNYELFKEYITTLKEIIDSNKDYTTLYNDRVVKCVTTLSLAETLSRNHIGELRVILEEANEWVTLRRLMQKCFVVYGMDRSVLSKLASNILNGVSASGVPLTIDISKKLLIENPWFFVLLSMEYI